MNKLDIDGKILDSFHVTFYHDKWIIEPKHIAMSIEAELYERLYICNKRKKNYAVYVVLAEMEERQLGSNP